MKKLMLALCAVPFLAACWGSKKTEEVKNDTAVEVSDFEKSVEAADDNDATEGENLEVTPSEQEEGTEK